MHTPTEIHSLSKKLVHPAQLHTLHPLWLLYRLSATIRHHVDVQSAADSVGKAAAQSK